METRYVGCATDRDSSLVAMISISVQKKEFYLQITNHSNEIDCIALIDNRVFLMLNSSATNEVMINKFYRMSGHLLKVRTLDLDQDFSRIEQGLREVVEELL